MKPFNVFPYDSHINFMRVRMVSLTIAALLMFVAIGAMAVNGFNFALDFTGGVGVELRFAKPVEVEAVRSRLAAAGYENAQVQSFGTGTDLLVRLQAKEGAASSKVATSVAQDVKQAASTADNPAEVRSSAEISAQVGKELRDKGILALVFVVLGFLIYISFRFEWKFAVAAIIATLHDVVIVVGWFALSGHEFDLTVLAGALSVMGYSVNDTIVVFDRVRENFRSMRATPSEVLNASINQTLSRTVITSFVAFLTVLALYIYGGNSLRGMAESQMIGIIIGTLSSIFVACPLLMWLGASKQDLMPKARDEAALARRP
ncbi:preprotein translocase subunit SecF [Lysobacter niabensis]|jgi:preprotein translocase subunit SecF|uniref:Protein-export membrane protein SecF n=1 Tax=Agrilutibacter niabensis TaxID=380628 RepID=A0ABU1VPD6_9GAMM|nr:protein translocase subunit SecF [Lysobacter niabensis]MDR7099317.1 preprotein translocase subunit SecF [Lysobacter niabensis]